MWRLRRDKVDTLKSESLKGGEAAVAASSQRDYAGVVNRWR
jgi:hypothetical protein